MLSSNESAAVKKYDIDSNPPLATKVFLGFQHYLTMLGATVAMPLVLSGPLGLEGDPQGLGLLIGTMFFTSGVGTLIQTRLGSRLPIVQGASYAFLAPVIAICAMASLSHEGWQVRMTHVQGAIILGGIFELVVGYTGLMGRMIKYIGPITVAPTIALIGLSLVKVGAPMAGSHWGLGAFTIVMMILSSQVFHRRYKIFALFPVLMAMALAWMLAIILSASGIVDSDSAAYVSFTAIANAPLIQMPSPFQWGVPVFGASALVGVMAAYVASMVESLGDYYACARLSGAPLPTAKVISHGIMAEGASSIIAGVFGGCAGTTSYSENIGAIAITGVGSRKVVEAGAIIMIVLGSLGKFSALFTTLPRPVVGGMYCVMFGMIVAVGLSNLQFINLNSSRNLLIIGFSLFMGLSIPEYIASTPLTLPIAIVSDTINTIASAGMAVGALTAFLLDNLLPGSDAERGITAWSAQHAAVVLN